MVLFVGSSPVSYTHLDVYKRQTIADDYQNLKEIVLEKRRDEVLDKWIREKQKHTYVRIKDNWKNNCTFKYPGWIKE